MPRNGYTLVLLTGNTPRGRQFHLTDPEFRGALLGGLLTVLALGYLGYHFLVFQVDYSELAHLRETVQAQEEMAAQLQTLAQELNRLRSFDTQIRRLAGMEAGPTPQGAPPRAVGGGTLELAKALKEGEQASQTQLLARLYQDLERLEREIALRAESLQAVKIGRAHV